MGKQFRITHDNHASGACFYVHKENRRAIQFNKHTGGLYYYDAGRKRRNNKTGHKADYMAMIAKVVKTVGDNKRNFTKHQIKAAEHVRCIDSMIGRPSTANYKGLVAGKLLADCPVVTEDIKNAEVMLVLILQRSRGRLPGQSHQWYVSM